MIKPLIILFNTVSVFLFSFFFGDSPVKVTGDFPKSTKPGTEFTASVVINKGSIGGFSKFQMEVPAGFTVKEQDSKSGSFSFANNIAKIIWTATPVDAEFTVKFNIVADASAAGAKTITSKFAYVNNNAKEVVEMAPAQINVEGTVSEPIVANTPTTPEPAAISTPEPSKPAVQETAPASTTTESKPVVAATSTNTEPAITTPATTFSKTDTTYFETSSLNDSPIICKRTISKDAAANVYNVEVKIKKGDVKGFAKYQEIIPAGYTAQAVSNSGSSFSVSDGKAKFVWVSLPPEESIIITYKLERGTDAADNASLAGGEFSYLENDQSKKVKLPIENISNSSYASLERVTPVATTPVASNQTNATTSLTNGSSTSGSNNSVNQSNSNNSSSTNSTTKTGISKSNGTAVSYLVQIGAFVNAIESDVLSRKFNINEPIKSELSAGFSKFMVGKFGEYAEARSHRETIKEKGCRSAFVVAYNGAKRITVQEALMITSQKWFK